MSPRYEIFVIIRQIAVDHQNAKIDQKFEFQDLYDPFKSSD